MLPAGLAQNISAVIEVVFMSKSSTKSDAIVNIAGYKFVHLDNLPTRRHELRQLCKSHQLKGTILLSPEGINLFLAGTPSSTEQFLTDLRTDPCFSDFRVKLSPGDRKPFNRLLVRLKKEIIAFGVDGIDPARRTSPKLTSKELKSWLDEGRPVTLLDVRNNYEVGLGTFENAVPVDIDHFREFPNAVAKLSESIKKAPVVMFCTGGIRCEKAGPFMEQAGFENVYQLDGGILQYFEDCGSAHYRGECFVFDQRVAVNPDLLESDVEVCFACQQILHPEDIQSEKYIEGEHCPFCFESPDITMKQVMEMRQAAVKVACDPLPGSVPYCNLRPLNVPQRFAGMRLVEFLSEFHPHIPGEIWKEKIRNGMITLDEQVLSPEHIVRGGQRIVHRIPGTTEPDVSAEIQILFEDEWIVVINKPAPLPMHPSGRFNRNTLTWILGSVYERPLRAAHRLDANTTGLVLFSKTLRVARILQPQFERQAVTKRYLAKIYGSPSEDEFTVDTPVTDQPVSAGGRTTQEVGRECVTDFKVVVKKPDNTTLLHAMPRTGRTNQIRVHLWSVGKPIVGDPTYLKERGLSETQTLPVNAPPMCLHAEYLRFTHPATGLPFEITAPVPRWMELLNEESDSPRG